MGTFVGVHAVSVILKMTGAARLTLRGMNSLSRMVLLGALECGCLLPLGERSSGVILDSADHFSADAGSNLSEA